MGSSGVELLQHFLDLGVLLLDSHQGLLDLLQAYLFVIYIRCARFIFLLAVVLDLLA